MRFIVVFLNVMPSYNMNFEMNEWMEKKMEKRMVCLLFNACVVLNLISYAKASFTKPKPIPQMMPTDKN